MNKYLTCVLQKNIDITALHSVFTDRMKKDGNSPGELHNFWEILVVVKGEMSAATVKDVFKVSENNLIIHPPMEYHRHFNQSDEDCDFAVISFDASTIPNFTDSLYKLTPQQVQDFLDIIEYIRQTCVIKRHMALEFKTEDIVASQKIKSQLELFMNATLTSKKEPRLNLDPTYKQIVEYLSANIDKPLTVPEIAKDIGMSISNLNHTFSKYSGIGIMKYFNQLKIQKAMDYLSAGMTVREVSERLSYSSQSVFSSAFKKATSLPPSKYHR